MWKQFKMDAARWVKQQQIGDPNQITPARALQLYARNLPLQATFWFRVGNWLKEKHLPMSGFIQRSIYRNYGFDINVGTEIGGGFYIAHPIGTAISAESIGENCSIISSVTIGMRNEWKFPRIGNRVFVGSGARILGGIHVGDDAIIGANAVVIHDVPPGATVVGIPARVIKIYGRPVTPRITAEDEPMEMIGQPTSLPEHL